MNITFNCKYWIPIIAKTYIKAYESSSDKIISDQFTLTYSYFDIKISNLKRKKKQSVKSNKLSNDICIIKILNISKI